MKQLLAGIVILIVVGIGGFLYRNALERPPVLGPVTNQPVACTTEAKICPDGSSVGRTGPNCAFSACAFPNIEDATLGIAYAVPVGYSATAASSSDATIQAVFDKPSSSSVPNSIIVRHYPIPAGKTANDVMIANTTYETSGKPATSMSEFKPLIVNGKTFYSVTVERFEGQIHTLYYLPRANDVLRFEILEKDVTNWTDSNLDVSTLPEHAALLKMLATLQTP